MILFVIIVGIDALFSGGIACNFYHYSRFRNYFYTGLGAVANRTYRRVCRFRNYFYTGLGARNTQAKTPHLPTIIIVDSVITFTQDSVRETPKQKHRTYRRVCRFRNYFYTGLGARNTQAKTPHLPTDVQIFSGFTIIGLTQF